MMKNPCSNCSSYWPDCECVPYLEYKKAVEESKYKTNFEMENKLQEHFKLYCQYKCSYTNENKYRDIEVDPICIVCGTSFSFITEVEYNPCESCQIQNFIREIRDEL